MRKTYQEQKEQARQKAIDFQLSFNSNNYSYYDIYTHGAYFEKLAHRFGLVKEFRENGII